MREDCYKLHHLECGKVFLPPDVSLVARAHGSHHVVEVHYDVHKRVEEGKERTVATWCKLESHPYRERHDTVVNDVKRGDMLVLFAQYKEERVKEFCELTEVIPPAGVRHPHGQRTPRIIYGLTS